MGPAVNIFGHAISMPQLYGQLLIGLINGSWGWRSSSAC
jgi:hypothetical protein